MTAKESEIMRTEKEIRAELARYKKLMKGTITHGMMVIYETKVDTLKWILNPK